MSTRTMTQALLLAAAATVLSGAKQPVPGGDDSAELTVERISLHFAEDEKTVTVAPEAELHAVAEINYGGIGRFNAIWEVATPPSTQGELVYEPLGSFNRTLPAAGHNSIESPPLPTARTGHYVLRLRVREPQGSIGPVSVRYNVSALAAEEADEADGGEAAGE